MRSSQRNNHRDSGLGKTTDTVALLVRPAYVEGRTVLAQWDRDLIFNANNGQMAMLVVRHTRYVMVAKVSGMYTASPFVCST